MTLCRRKIHYDEKLEPTLTYYGTRVVVGSDEYLTQKVVQMAAVDAGACRTLRDAVS